MSFQSKIFLVFLVATLAVEMVEASCINTPPFDPIVTGGLTPQEVLAVIRANSEASRKCMKLKKREPNDNLNAVEMQWTIQQSGATSNVEPIYATVANEAVNACLAKAISKWKFPKPRGGQAAKVVSPFFVDYYFPVGQEPTTRCR